MPVRSKLSQMTNEEIKEQVVNYNREHPNAGNCMNTIYFVVLFYNLTSLNKL